MQFQRTTDTYRSSVLPLRTFNPPASATDLLGSSNRSRVFGKETQKDQLQNNSEVNGSFINTLGRSKSPFQSKEEQKKHYKEVLDQQISEKSQLKSLAIKQERQAERSIVETIERLARSKDAVDSSH